MLLESSATKKKQFGDGLLLWYIERSQTYLQIIDQGYARKPQRSVGEDRHEDMQMTYKPSIPLTCEYTNP